MLQSAMMGERRQTVRIKFENPGTRPPVFVAGTFTTPSWTPQELRFTRKQPVSDGETGDQAEGAALVFFEDFEIPEGQYQYKFRLGHGDWWICDDAVDTVTDEAGNRNNLLKVQSSDESQEELSERPPEPGMKPATPVEVAQGAISDHLEPTYSRSGSPRLEHAPLFAHETMSCEPDAVEDRDAIPITESERSSLPHSNLASRVVTPAVEQFPVEKGNILAQIESTMVRMKEDETSVNGSPASPVAGSKHGLATPSSSKETSPALVSISEELSEPPKDEDADIGRSHDTSYEDSHEDEQWVPISAVPPLDGGQDTLGTENSQTSRKSDETVTKAAPDSNKLSKHKDEGLLNRLWHAVFVTFLGGLFASLCGRRGHEQLLMTYAVMIIPFAAVYLYKQDWQYPLSSEPTQSAPT